MEYFYYENGVKTTEIKEYKLLQVYNNHSLVIDSKIIDFWVKQNSLPNYENETIIKRLSEVLYIVLDSNDDIVGTSTGTPVYFEPIKKHFLYFRLFVKDGHRGENRGIAISMYYAAYDYFNIDQNIENQKVIGLLIVYESEHLNSVIDYYHSSLYRNQFFWGYNDKMQQVRITYFENNKLF